MKYVLLAVVVFGLLWWIGRQRRGPRAGPPSAPPSDAASRRSIERESMVRCAHCGMHLPASEAVKNDGGEVFCGREHLLVHERRDDRS
jgi:uncharacterized protein